ncbi:tetratricopeptide repeat protein [Sphingomonas radiodurans]|uniref:tetratricopeptide repeat protein n=1 Tax=Sphingomonas radiodurans TaxID=2890321 RepID=UPI001E5F2BCC|nr:tetratricopeptide repeat protein [Sphingomonas radiodurans]WBH17285.1 hypothetical protein LLW23_04020 [Sphingomonas radiodurans]
MPRKWIVGGLVALAATGTVAAIGLTRPAATPSTTAQQPRRELLLPPPAPATADLAQLQAATRRSPGSADAWIALGDYQLRAKAFADAIASYDKGLAIDPARSATWSALGEAHIQTQRSDTAKMPAEARAAFDKALALDPDDMRANFYAIMERDFLGQHDRAIGEWLQMLRRAPMGSDADEAIRAAMAASINRNLVQIKRAMADATRVQPQFEAPRPGN